MQIFIQENAKDLNPSQINSENPESLEVTDSHSIEPIKDTPLNSNDRDHVFQQLYIKEIEKSAAHRSENSRPSSPIVEADKVGQRILGNFIQPNQFTNKGAFKKTSSKRDFQAIRNSNNGEDNNVNSASQKMSPNPKRFSKSNTTDQTQFKNNISTNLLDLDIK